MDCPNLVDMGNSRSPVLGERLFSPHVCTATDLNLCHIYSDLRVWNDFLCVVDLELREEPPSQLYLVSMGHFPPQPDTERMQHEALTLVYFLLNKHGCVHAFRMKPWFYYFEYKKVIGVSPLRCLALKCLALDFASRCPELDDLTFDIPFLNLVELQCHVDERPEHLTEALSLLLSTSSSLKTLDLCNWNFTADEAERFLDALMLNTTLTALFVNTTLTMHRNENCGRNFAHFIRSNSTLTALGIRNSNWKGWDDFTLFVSALNDNRSLLNVSLEGFIIDLKAAAALETLLKENLTIQSLSLSDCVWFEFAENPGCSANYIQELPEYFRPFIQLLRQNHPLRELGVTLLSLTPVQCVAFFMELIKVTRLSRLTIEVGNLRRTSRVGPKKMRQVGTNSSAVSPRKHSSEIVVWLRERKDVIWLGSALPAIHSCSHITSAKIRLTYQKEAISLAAKYIESASALRELTLLLPQCSSVQESTASEWRKTILGALLSNKNVRKLCLRHVICSDQDASVMASIIKSSENLHDLRIGASAAVNQAFLGHLLPGFYQKFTLVFLHFFVEPVEWSPHCITVREIVRRNLSMVNRAAHYVLGNRSRCCLEALEPVASNPALLEKISQLASVSEQEAAKKVLESVQGLQSLDDFMRAVGVVKERVCCGTREDGRLQLDDLNEYCWLSVRQYLNVADVVHA